MQHFPCNVITFYANYCEDYCMLFGIYIMLVVIVTYFSDVKFSWADKARNYRQFARYERSNWHFQMTLQLMKSQSL